jgi:WW domain-binding protein 11
VRSGVPPPRLVRPPGIPPPNVPPPSFQPPAASVAGPTATAGVLSAPPSIMKPPLKALVVAGTEDERRRVAAAATIEAKPQIRHVIGDSTRFMPTALRVKREMKDAKGHIIKPPAVTVPGIFLFR